MEKMEKGFMIWKGNDLEGWRLWKLYSWCSSRKCSSVSQTQTMEVLKDVVALLGFECDTRLRASGISSAIEEFKVGVNFSCFVDLSKIKINTAPKNTTLVLV